MSGLLWVLFVGAAGWLTGKIIGGHGYGTALGSSVSDWLDFIIGISGASIGGYLIFGGGIEEGGLISRYATAVIGSVILVSVARMLAARYLLATGRK